ncbi:uncharacterized protein LOC131631477 [Vicia villosa]|uniref:uncharacterized protein LOC131631477 n=1 Tax=Vicia villosa TaxID=3911 RepID=UPI00273BF5C6|nr:uncharacterized protein LOC131631477 [Vicia villosa]
MPKKVGGMGFKNLSAFNYVVLSKQAWSLMTKPNTLVSCLYKARYFPNCDFLKSEIGHNPSYVWRSIWSAKFMVRGGYKWSIGTGECISVWDQNWLYDSSVVSNLWPDNPMVENLKVSDLINPTGKHWKLNLIYPLVGGEVAQKIVNTPLFEAVHADKMVWNLEKNSWRDAQQARSIASPIDQSVSDPKWCKPPSSWLKCNSDASFSSNKVGICVCIRNDEGMFITAQTKWFSPITDVDTGEALGLLAAINWVLDLGYDNVVFESDSKSVVDSVTIPKPNDSDFGTITGVCFQLLTHSTRNFQVKFIRRQANEVAHALAKTAPSLASFHIFNDVPTCIYNLIINEMI